MKIPFGIAQIGKAFRNEIVARQFIFRMREFEQMEMQFFVRPGSELDWFKKWKETRMSWHQALGSDRRIPVPRSRETGALRKCSHRHRIPFPIRL